MMIVVVLSDDQVSCVLIMAGLYVSYLASGIFLLLESLIILTSLTTSLSLPLISSAWCLGSSSLATPLVYTLVTFSLLQPQQVRGDLSLCWADVTQPTSALFLVPAVLLSLASITTIILSYFTQHHHHQDNARTVTIATNRHSVLAISLLVTIISSLGPVVHTTSTSSPLLWVCYHLARAGLSAAVIVRTLNDTQVRRESERYQEMFFTRLF